MKKIIITIAVIAAIFGFIMWQDSNYSEGTGEPLRCEWCGALMAPSDPYVPSSDGHRIGLACYEGMLERGNCL